MINAYLTLATAHTLPPDISTPTYGLVALPLYFTLREHHCISPRVPVRPGGELIDIGEMRRARGGRVNEDGDEDGDDFLAFDEGLYNAWFPEGTAFNERNGEVRVSARGASEPCTYTTWDPRRPSAHDPQTCEMCASQREQGRRGEMGGQGDEGEQGEQGPGDGGGARSQLVRVDPMELLDEEMEVDDEDDEDDDDEEEEDGADVDAGSECSDFVEHTCSGISDIIFTGEVSPIPLY